MPRRFLWLAVGLVAASTLFLAAVSPLSRWASLTAIALVAGMLVLGVAFYMVAEGRVFARPESFEGTPELQIAPTSPAYHAILAGQILMTGSLCCFAIKMWNDDPSGLAVMFSAAAVVSVAATTVLLVRLTRGIPRVELTPQALVLHDLYGSRRIPWQALSQGAPVLRVARGHITLTINDRKLVQPRGFSGRSGEVALSYVAVSPQFLAESIHWRVVGARVA